MPCHLAWDAMSYDYVTLCQQRMPVLADSRLRLSYVDHWLAYNTFDKNGS